MYLDERITEDFLAKLLGVKKGEIITRQHVSRLTKAQLRKICVAMQGMFASNSYDYEFYKISPKDIARLIAVLVKRDDVLKRDVFVEWYISKLYGTKLYGTELVRKLAGGKPSEDVTKEEILKNFADASKGYALLFQ